MASDPKQPDEGSREPTPDSDTARRRKIGGSGLLEISKPVSADRSLDAFIARANQELVEVDLAPFKPENREGALRREIEDLQAKLAKLEVRATQAEVHAAAIEARARSPRWGGVIAAFLTGGAAMFAVSFFLLGKAAPAVPAAPVATSPTVTPIAPAPTGITVQPLPEPEPAAPPTAVKPELVAEKVATPPVREKGTKKAVGKTGVTKPGTHEQPAPAVKPPEDDLYNPF